MSVLNAHLESISLSCQGIDSLPFPPPKIFTNALLHNDDITSLIRDTESHERALFSVPPPPPLASVPPGSTTADHAPSSATAPSQSSTSDRRKTVFAVSSGEVTASGGPGTGRPAARHHTAVAAVLGGELHGKLTGRAGTGADGGYDDQGDKASGAAAGDVDVDVLLRGAEKLCGVYALPGAPERIAALRGRWARHGGTVAYYEGRVAELGEALGRQQRLQKQRWTGEGEEDEDEDEGMEEEIGAGGDAPMTEEDLRAEEEEVRELDRKKRELQARLRAMEKDLGGLLRM